MEFSVEDIAMMRKAFREYLMCNNIPEKDIPRAQQLFEKFGQWKRYNDAMRGIGDEPSVE
jgi:hypothetical protein